MGKIDVSEWKNFKLIDLFDISGSTTTPKSDLEFDKNEKYPYVTTAASNNGICGYSNQYTEKGGCLTIDSAVLGSCFYQKENFTASDHVEKLIPNFQMNEKIGMFIACLLNCTASLYGYAYNEKRSQKALKTESLLLPATPSGDPDWECMENYMKNIEEKVNDALSKMQVAKEIPKKSVDVSGWKEFRIGDLFDIHPTKAYKKTNAELFENDGVNPVIVNSGFNNGVGGYSNDKCTEKGGIITFSDTTTADAIFYQKDDFIGYPHVQGMYAIGNYKNNWSLYSMKYFETVFRSKAIASGYDYVNKFTREAAKEIVVRLPVTSSGDPDWAYMEYYMRKIEEKVINNLERLAE